MKYFFYLFLIFSTSVHAATYTVKLGSTRVKILKKTGSGKTFIHLHQNEVTALAAAKLFIKKEGGTLITLKHSGQRNIVFYLKKTRYEFDPNRIFTDIGIKRTLNQFGPYSVAAHQEVKKFAAQIIALLPPGKVIAVHNNKNYSIKEYLPQNALANDIGALHYLPETNHRNFYFVTKQADYERLKKLQFNVALQAKNAQDDGSLSFYLAQKDYVNIESAYGQLNAQIKMIRHA